MDAPTIKALSLYEDVEALAQRCWDADTDNSPVSVVNGTLGAALFDALARINVGTISRLAAREHQPTIAAGRAE